MADQGDDENYFSDDGLDGLPQSTLNELEQRAVSSTQQQIAARRVKQYHQAARPYKLSVPSNGWQQPVQARTTSLPPAQEPPSSDYGLDDEDVVDLDEPSLLPQPASAPQHFAQNNFAQQDTYAEADYHYDQGYAAQDHDSLYQNGQQYSEIQHPGSPNNAQPDLLALQARVKEV